LANSEGSGQGANRQLPRRQNYGCKLKIEGLAERPAAGEMHMLREHFDLELTNLREDVLSTASEVEENLLKVTNALIERNTVVAEQLIAADKYINQRYIKVVMGSLKLIATQQPMAGDMRLIAAVIEIMGELERIHDYVKGIAKTSLEIGPDGTILPAIAEDLPQMTKITQDMLNRAMIAFTESNAALARTIPASDNLVDDLFNRLYAKIIAYASGHPERIAHANQLEWVVHNMERSADRVINICEWVIYNVTGEYRELDSEYETAPMP
jgi:phosphate transport system protein